MSLVSVIEYRNWTGDLTTASTTVTAIIAEATSLAEDDCQRLFESQAVTERLQLWPDQSYAYGWVYPTVTPVTAVSVGGSVDEAMRSRILVDSAPSIVFNTPTLGRPVFVTVTYTGGYTASTCPARLKHAIARLAFAVRTTPNGSMAVAGTIRVGDISIQRGAVGSGLDQLVPGIGLTLKAFRKRVRKNPESLLLVGGIA